MIPLAVKDGFIICFDTLQEGRDMRTHFIKDMKMKPHEFAKIKNYLWFTAVITAWKDGEELGTSYMGGCAYKTIHDCIQSGISGYLPQMIDEAIAEAVGELQRNPNRNPMSQYVHSLTTGSIH